MFAKIMAVVMAAILITTVGLSAVWWITLRNQQIDARLEYLISEAKDIAYLAASLPDEETEGSWFSWVTGFRDYMAVYLGGQRDGYVSGYYESVSTTLNAKAAKVSEEFGAYIAVVDRNGSVLDNAVSAYGEDPEFVKSLSGSDILNALERIRAGENIRIRSESGEAPTFTVGVPFVQDGKVVGAVFIQTKAQRIESGMEDLLLKVGGIAAGAILLTGVALFLFVRSAMKPLRSLTDAAEAIAEGDMTVQVEEKKGDRKMREVSRAFNSMTQKLRGVEEGRREFVANVSHELRTPITSIRGFAEGMADGVIPAEEQPKYLRLVADESKRVSDLVGDLLALSRLEREDAKPEYAVFDINEMLRRAIIRRMDDLEKKRIEAACEPETDPCPVRADKDRIEQVVINLLDNAIKFTPEDGKITLESTVNGQLAEITVRDSGPGIPEEDREKIFERFFTGDRAHTSGKGTGLGLSICRRIMEMHGQTLKLLDTEEGAAFRFTLETAPDGLTGTEKHA